MRTVYSQARDKRIPVLGTRSWACEWRQGLDEQRISLGHRTLIHTEVAPCGGRGRCGSALGSRTAAQGAPLTPGARLGAEPELLGGHSRMPALGAERPGRNLCGLSVCFLPKAPKEEGCELSCSAEAPEGLGGPWVGPICLAAPALRVWGRTGLGQPSPLWGQGPVGTVAWTPLSAQVVRAPGTRARSPPASGPGAQTPGTFPAAPAPSPRVCVCRLRLPAWADSARLPLREHQPDSPVLSSGYSGGDFSIRWFQQKPGSTRNTS